MQALLIKSKSIYLTIIDVSEEKVKLTLFKSS